MCLIILLLFIIIILILMSTMVFRRRIYLILSGLYQDSLKVSLNINIFFIITFDNRLNWNIFHLKLLSIHRSCFTASFSFSRDPRFYDYILESVWMLKIIELDLSPHLNILCVLIYIFDLTLIILLNNNVCFYFNSQIIMNNSQAK